MSVTPRSNSAALESIELMNGAVLRECKVLEIELKAAKQRIIQLEQENDAMRADLLLWREQEVKP